MEPDAARQYATTRKLGARGSLHDRYAPTSWFAWVAERLPLSAGDRVLDIGCGPAWFWRSALVNLPNDLHLTLTDAAPVMVEAARFERVPAGVGSLVVEQAEASALPYPDESFDVAIAMHMLYHVADPSAVCAQMLRVVRPGGHVAVTTNTRSNFRRLGEIGAAAFGGSSDDLGAASFSLDDAEALLAGSFTDIERHDLVDEYRITDRRDVAAFLLSMPPGDEADDAAIARMNGIIADAMREGDGAVVTTRETGMVTARKPA